MFVLHLTLMGFLAMSSPAAAGVARQPVRSVHDAAISASTVLDGIAAPPSQAEAIPERPVVYFDAPPSSADRTFLR